MGYWVSKGMERKGCSQGLERKLTSLVIPLDSVLRSKRYEKPFQVQDIVPWGHSKVHGLCPDPYSNKRPDL